MAFNQEHFAQLIDEFTVNSEQLREIAADFRYDLRLGLKNPDESSLRMLKSYLGLPSGKETGEYLEVDATRMGRRIRELAPDLLKYDDILVRWPNKNGGVNGRKITFEQRGYNGNESGT